MADALGPLAPYRKTIVAVVGAVIVSLTAALTLTGLPLVIAIVTAVATAFGVYGATNAPQPEIVEAEHVDEAPPSA